MYTEFYLSGIIIIIGTIIGNLGIIIEFILDKLVESEE